MLKRASSIAAAWILVASPLAVGSAAEASVPMASIPVACADSVSSLTVVVDEVVSFGPVPSGCTVVNNSATGNLDRVSASGFVAFAAGTGAVFQLMTDGTTQYLVKVDVTIEDRPTPTPDTPTPDTPTSPTPSATAATATATASSAPTPVPLVSTVATAPEPSQQLRPKDVAVGPALEPGTVAFFNDKGHPLQLLSVSGDRDAVRILNRGMDYSSTPANWQRLGYGDLCWTYAGYRGVQGLVLPVGAPPFATVPADWVLTAAIATTSSGNRIVLDPVPGAVLTADGRDVNAVTLCADGYAPQASARSVASPRMAPDRGNIGGNVGTGQCRGNGNFKHGCEPSYPNVDTGVVYPVLNPVTGSTGTSTTSPSPSPRPTSASTAPPEADPLLPVCRATGDPENPYRLETLRVSEISEGEGNRLFPTEGWTDVIPPNRLLPDGQNWPSGAGMLTTAGAKCQVTKPVDQPQPSATPTPTPTVTALPQPTFTELGPVPTVTPVPQPVFTAYGTITPWPPLYPIPVPTPLLVPTATPTPTAVTASPTATPDLPSESATATPVATPSPATPSPFPIPASPTPYATPTPTASLATPPPLPKVPTLIPPLQEPSVPLTPVIALREPSGATASPTATPTAKPRPTATATPAPTAAPTTQATASPTATPSVTTGTASSTAAPTAIPDPQTSLASPTATPPTPTAAAGTAVPTAIPSPETSVASPTATPPLPSPESTPSASSEPPLTDGSRTVTVLLTNGPDTVTYTTTIDALQAVVDQTDSALTGATDGRPDGTTDGKPGTGPTELANTGATEAWLIVGGFALAGGALLLLPVARGRRLRIGVVVGLTAAGLVTSTTAAWSVASAERAFGIAQAQASMDWGSSPDAIARLTFVRPGGQSPIGPDPVYVFDGIDESTLTRGPGWYPTTAAPGAPGTTAIAGHRTGYGSPFADLDELRSGDTIVMQTPQGDRRTFRVAEVRLVNTDDVWVLGPDPLGTGTSTLTLTTCDPPGVNTQRLVVIATLVAGSSPA